MEDESEDDARIVPRRETDPKYAAAALDGCEMQNTLSLRTQAFA